MKALEILKELTVIISTARLFYENKTNFEFNRSYEERINEAIEELENISSLQSTMSCNGCFYNKYDSYIMDTNCLDCSRGYPDMYEEKNKTLHQVTKMTSEQAKELFKDCKVDFVIEKLYQYFTEPYTKG